MLARLACVLAATAVVGLVGAAPAWAHVAGGAQPSNYRVRLTAIRPPAPDLAVHVGVGQQVRLANHTHRVVTVGGYRGEPFLRLSPNQVEVNQRSTVLADNPRLARGPAQPKPAASPQWAGVGDGASVTWSDARLTGGPGTRNRARDEGRWRLPLRVGDTRATVTGTWSWVAPPPRWAWGAGLAGAALAVAAAGWLRRWHAMATAVLAAAGAAHIAHTVGAALAAQAYGSGWGAILGVGLVVWALIAVGAITAWRRSEHAGLAVAIAGVVLVLIGLGDLSAFGYSQLPFAWPASTQRVLLIGTLGSGAGLLVAGLHRIITPDQTRPDQPQE